MKIRTPKHELVRPVQKLCLLPIVPPTSDIASQFTCNNVNAKDAIAAGKNYDEPKKRGNCFVLTNRLMIMNQSLHNKRSHVKHITKFKRRQHAHSHKKRYRNSRKY